MARDNPLWGADRIRGEILKAAKKTKAIHDAKRFASATEVDMTSRSTIFSFR